MTEKPNSAEFADQREQAMLRSRRAGNPGLRLVPEMSAKAAKTSEPLGTIESDAPPSFQETDTDASEDIDYHATSQAILDALRKIESNVKLSKEERKEAHRLLSGNYSENNVLHMLVVLVLGIIVGSFTSGALRRKTSE